MHQEVTSIHLQVMTKGYLHPSRKLLLDRFVATHENAFASAIAGIAFATPSIRLSTIVRPAGSHTVTVIGLKFRLLASPIAPSAMRSARSRFNIVKSCARGNRRRSTNDVKVREEGHRKRETRRVTMSSSQGTRIIWQRAQRLSSEVF